MNGFAGKLALASALVLFTAGASAQSGTTGSSSTGTMGSGTMGSGAMGSMHHMRSNGSMHKMPATVKSVDTQTGVVEATTEGMDLKLHFPPKSVADLKAGDKITLHMGYTKP